MGRKRKQADIEDAIDDAEKAGVGHNKPADLTDDEKRALFFQHKRIYELALAAKKQADSALKNVCKKAKAECGNDAVSDIKDAIAFEGDDGREKFTAEIERKHRVARWLGLPVGSEPSFFEAVDRAPSEDAAYDEGKRAGMAGEIRRPPHDPSVPQYDRWLTGWSDGQQILASAFNKLKTEPPVSEDDEHVDTSDRPFGLPAEPMPESPTVPA